MFRVILILTENLFSVKKENPRFIFSYGIAKKKITGKKIKTKMLKTLDIRLITKVWGQCVGVMMW